MFTIKIASESAQWL